MLEPATDLRIEPQTDERIEYTVSREDTIAAMQESTQIMLRSVRWGTVMYVLTAASVACGIVIGMGYIELVNGYIGRNWRLQWLIAVAFLAICLLTIWQQRLRAARIYATCVEDDGRASGPQALALSADALTHEARGTTARIAWHALKQVVQYNHKLLILLRNYSFIVVPFKAFSSTAHRDAWIAALREHVPDEAWAASQTPAPALTRVMHAPPVPAALTGVFTTAFGVNENLRAGTRLAFFRRVQPHDFVATPEAFITLVVLTLLLLLALGITAIGINGQFNYHELPRALLFVPLLLLFGVVAARAAEDRALLLALPVALAAASLVAYLVCGIVALLMIQKVIVAGAKHWQWLFYFQVAWWAAIIMVASWRLAPALSRRTAGVSMLGVALLVAPGIWYPRNHLWIPAEATETRNEVNEKYFALADEKGFYAQHDALQRALSALLPERPGIIDLYTLTAGLYASEDVFMKEVKFIDALMRQRFDAEGRSLVLVNNPKTVHELPLATATSLSAALKHIGGLMNREEDVLVLYVSSHGSDKHDLSVDFWPLRLKPINPAALKRALDASQIKWKVLVVSACYSGGFVAPLQDENTLIITASSATKTSFGCGNESDATYLAKALFDEALRKTYSFETAFAQARETILRREQTEKHEPSDPQIFVGAAIRERLLQVEQRLSGLKP